MILHNFRENSRVDFGIFDVLTLYRRTADRFIYRPSPYRAVKTFRLGYKNQSVHAVSGTSRCLFSDKYKTHKYSVGRAYDSGMLNLLVPGSSVGLATNYGLDGPGSNPGGDEIFRPGDQPAFCTMGTGSYPAVEAAEAWA